MNTIKLNNITVKVQDYNKNTYLTEGIIASNASCNIYDVTDFSPLHALMEDTITDIAIFHDGEKIYELTNQNCKLNNVNEYLNGDAIYATLTLVFDMQ